MAYVALSRVTSLNGLHIIDLSRDKIVANRSALDEYSRLRSLYTPHLAGYPVRETAKLRDKKPTKRKMPQTSTMEETMPAVPTAACVMSNSNDTTLQTATTSTTRDNTVIITAVTTSSIFRFCQVETISDEYQKMICNQLNLPFQPITQRSVQTPVSQEIQQFIL